MSDVVSGVTVNRWRRYGKDRLYVSAADGDLKIGWWDLVSGEGHPESPERLGTLLAAVEEWKVGHVLPPAVATVVAPAEAPVVAAVALAPSTSEVAVEPAVEPVLSLAAEPVHTPAEEHLPVVTTPGPQPATRPWIDLATNRAGAEAREQAAAARDAAPVKTFLARVLDKKTEERAWRIGADGEEKVAVRLAKLARKDPRWRFLHAIPVGDRGSDIDHLVIGPGGIFTVNAKHHPGAKIWVGGDTVMVNGHRQPYVRNSRHEAARAARLLTAACGFPVHAEGVLVTVNADDIVIKKAPAGVHVVPRMQVARWLRRHGDILGSDVLDQIFDAARRSTTWRP